jgi:hypothetical protein
MDKMAAHKAPGLDGMPAEFLCKAICVTEGVRFHVLATTVARLFDLVFTGGSYPESWGQCALVPVPKPKGDPKDRDSYRGIAVGPALGKLYSMVLLARLDTWAETQGLRAAGQAGFREGRSAADNVFVIQHVQEQYQAGGRPLFAAFIDFRKAYDCVNRELLWQSLAARGVHGGMMSALRNMYSHIAMQVKCGGSVGVPFPAEVGVKQGDPLSPLLFGLFIDRLESFLSDACPGVGVWAGAASKLQLLLYADDLVLLGETPAELQKLLDCLHNFCLENLMAVNVPKCAVMGLGACPPGAGGLTLQYAGQDLPTVDKFCYLGTMFRSESHCKTNLERCLHTANFAMRGMMARCDSLALHNPMVQFNLFNALVASV